MADELVPSGHLFDPTIVAAGTLGAWLLGPAIRAGGKALLDEVNALRIVRLDKLVRDVNSKLGKRGSTLRADVSPEISLRFIEMASSNNDDDLHVRWVNLIANFHDGTQRKQQSLAFASILNDMTGLDAVVLTELRRVTNELAQSSPAGFQLSATHVANNLLASKRCGAEELHLALNSLRRLGLVYLHANGEENGYPPPPLLELDVNGLPSSSRYTVGITHIGRTFLDAVEG